MPRSFPFTLVLLYLCAVVLAKYSIPRPIYGVNLGGWLLTEPWMNPKEWKAMGGQNCTSCQSCIGTEEQLATKLGQKQANQVFAKHWKSWFTQSDVKTLKSLKINAARIPLGYWIFDDLVLKGEVFAQGGLEYLKKGAAMLARANIGIVLDAHALPGAQTPNQAFTGVCTSRAGFYNPTNFTRGLKMTAGLAALAHADPDFKTAFSIQAINEPAQNPSQTSNLLQYYKDFAATVRATEKWLGMSCGSPTASGSSIKSLDKDTIHFVQSLLSASGLKTNKPPLGGYEECLTLTYADPLWQYAPYENNPVKATIGPTLYDDHLYTYFGGIVDPTYEAHMTYFCNFPRFLSDASYGAAQPEVIFGEWWNVPSFPITNKQQIKDFADAQKLAYSSGAGFFFWSFKIEAGNDIGTGDVNAGILRDYVQSVKNGYLTKNPASYFNKKVCAKWTLPTKAYAAPTQSAQSKFKEEI